MGSSFEKKLGCDQDAVIEIIVPPQKKKKKNLFTRRMPATSVDVNKPWQYFLISPIRLISKNEERK